MLHRLNVVPLVHPFTSSLTVCKHSSSSKPTLTLQCYLTSHTRLAYLQDHVVMGMKLLPAAAMMEFAIATAATATADAAAEEALMQISKMAISAPIIMPSEAAPGEAVVVCCQLELMSGRLTISYSQGASTMQIESASCEVAMLPMAADGITKISNDITTNSSCISIVSATSAAQLQSIMAAFPQLAVAAAAASQGGSPAAAAPACAGSDAACGIVHAVDDTWYSSGYLSSPAQVDAAFHLGVASPDAVGAKVPVAVGSFLVPVRRDNRRGGGSSGLGQIFANTTGTLGRTDGKRRAAGKTSVASFYLKDAAGTGGDGDLVAVVDQLETMVVEPGAARRQRAAAAGAKLPAEQEEEADQRRRGVDDKGGESPCSYEVEWVVEQPKKMTRADGVEEGMCCLQEGLATKP